MIFLVLCSIFILMSLYFLFLGTKVLFTRKPYVISAKYNFYVVFVAFASQLVLPVKGLFRQSSSIDQNIDWFITLSPLFLVVFYAVLLFYLWKSMQGYLVIGVDEDSFRNSLQTVLKGLGLPFEERLSKMRLTSLDTDLQSSINAWSGVATIKLKDAKHKKAEREIAEGLQTHFSYEKVPINLRTSYFYLFFGSLLFIFFIGFGYWSWTREVFWKSF